MDYSPWVCKGSETIENACISIFKKILNIVNIIFWYVVHRCSICLYAFLLSRFLMLKKKKKRIEMGLAKLTAQAVCRI